MLSYENECDISAVQERLERTILPSLGFSPFQALALYSHYPIISKITNNSLYIAKAKGSSSPLRALSIKSRTNDMVLPQKVIWEPFACTNSNRDILNDMILITFTLQNPFVFKSKQKAKLGKQRLGTT